MDIRRFAAIALLAVSPGVRADAAAPLVVHEWGTFTSVQGGDGVQVEWNPLIKTDLPDFVYSAGVNNGGFRNVMLRAGSRKDEASAILRMETPVIYFYSATERRVNVRVSFPSGQITEWYPQAHAVGPHWVQASGAYNNQSLIVWNDVRILSRTTNEIQPQQLLRDREDIHARHYYAARATDANLLRVSAPYARSSKFEYERDLFYRGLGHRAAPLIVTASDDGRSLTVSVAAQQPVPDAFVLTIDRELARYQQLGALSPTQERTIDLDVESFDALASVRNKLTKEMIATLMRQGLFAREAKAMVETWKDQWFEESGTRVLYVLPPSWTDETLPLTISPQPDALVRVMIGRAEVVVPPVVRELQRQIVVFQSGAADARQQAIATVAGMNLGRFLDPATTMALGRSPRPEAWNAAAELKNQVHRLQTREQVAQSAALAQ